MIADFRKKQKTDKDGSGRAVFFGFVAFLCFVAFVGVMFANLRLYSKKQKLYAQLTDLQNQVANLKTSNDLLKESITKAQDNDYMEKIAREQLDLQKSGENVVSFIAPDKSEQKSADAQGIENWFFAVWQKIKSMLK